MILVTVFSLIYNSNNSIQRKERNKQKNTGIESPNTRALWESMMAASILQRHEFWEQQSHLKSTVSTKTRGCGCDDGCCLRNAAAAASVFCL